MTPVRWLAALSAFLIACTTDSVPTAAECAGARGRVQLTGPLTEDLDVVCPGVQYEVPETLVVRAGATLSIGPGVTISFAESVGLVVGDESGGAIVAEGTPDAPVTLTSLDGEGSWWNGVVVEAGATNAVFRHAVFDRAGATDAGPVREGAALRVSSQAEVVDSTFRGSLGYGVRFDDGASAVAFSGNSFADNDAEMVSIFGNHVGSLGGRLQAAVGDAVRVQGDTIEASATWGDIGAPYRIVDDLRVGGEESPTLTIEPGVVLRFAAQASLTVGQNGPGAIVARGTQQERIVFTSDDDTPAPGDWEGVQIESGTADFLGVDFRYAGDAQFDTSVATQAGLAVLGGEVSLEDCGLFDHDFVGLRVGPDGRLSRFVGNRFEGNVESPLRVSVEALGSLSGANVFDQGDVIQVDGGTVSQTATWSDVGAPYRIQDDVYVEGGSEPVLTLEPGVELRLARDVSVVLGFDQPGRIEAVTVNDDPIVFTSGSMSPPAPGDWGALIFDRNGGGILDGIEFAYCGDATSDGSQEIEACIGIVGPARPTIQRCALRRSQQHGIEYELGGSFVDTVGTSNSFDFIGGEPIFID